MFAPRVFVHELGNGATVGQCLLNENRTLLCQPLLAGLWVVVEGVSDEALAIANHPYFVLITAINGRTCRHSPRGRLMQKLEVGVGILIFVSDGKRGSRAKLLTGGVGRHVLDSFADDKHGKSPVSHRCGELNRTFAGASIDDRNEVVSRHYAVFARFLALFAYDALLYYCHQNSD